MPLYGTLDLAAPPPHLPVLRDLDTAVWALPKAEILQLGLEVPRDSQALLPPALHPSVPAYAVFAVTRYPESPVGPFNLAMVRLASRAGAHPRGFVLGAVASTADAATALRERWGIPAERGEVALQRRHDRISGRVKLAGTTILDCALVDPEPIAGGDVQYISWVTRAATPLDGKTAAPMLVQVDPRYTIHKAERGRPEISLFDAAAWHAGTMRPLNPIVGTVTVSDTDLPRIRFVMDEAVPVFRGTRRIRESRDAD
jgi:hypothetical protein